MSETDPMIVGSVPSGRMLETPGHDPNYVGTLGVLRRADEASLRLARRNLREIQAEDIEGQGIHLVETATDETWEVITTLVDLGDPKASGAEAFVVRDDLLVPLRRPEWAHEANKSLYVGEFYGRKAVGSDPAPMPVEMR